TLGVGPANTHATSIDARGSLGKSPEIVEEVPVIRANEGIAPLHLTKSPNGRKTTQVLPLCSWWSVRNLTRRKYVEVGEYKRGRAVGDRKGILRHIRCDLVEWVWWDVWKIEANLERHTRTYGKTTATSSESTRSN